MTQHDTWVFLSDGTPFDAIKELFPTGIPMRDPFASETTMADGVPITLWVIDLARLNARQFHALATVISVMCGVSPGDVADEAIACGGFAIRSQYIETMYCGPEGIQRSRELADFLDSAPRPATSQAWENFWTDQRARWIDGNEVPPPLPESIEEVDPRLRTPELEQAIAKYQIYKKLSGHSVLDVLTGRAVVEALNQLDPDHSYSLAGDEGDEDEEEF